MSVCDNYFGFFFLDALRIKYNFYGYNAASIVKEYTAIFLKAELQQFFNWKALYFSGACHSVDFVKC